MAARSRHARQIKQIGTLRLSDLPPGIQADVAGCLKLRLERIYNIEEAGAIFTDDLLSLLVSLDPELPLLMVDTALLVRAGRDVNEDVIAEYREVWATGEVRFPPVVIDSESEGVLCEGGHRSFSAYQAGVKAIQAVDVAAIDPEAVKQLLPIHNYRILMSSEAELAYVSMDRGAQRQLDALFDRLEAWPEVSGAVALWGPGKGHFRMKTRGWRVIFHVDESSRELMIDKVADRKTAYEEYH
jgi:mRNA-degrading endonuclease RelE of RelBE toxin-antitoxin system